MGKALGFLSPGYTLWGTNIAPYWPVSQPVSGLGLGPNAPFMNAAFVLSGIPLLLGVAGIFQGISEMNRPGRRVDPDGYPAPSAAFTELKFSNSMIEARWRSLKHQWLFLHRLDSVTTVRRLVAFYVDQHNRVLPHSAFHGQTPDEMYFGTGEAVPADLRSRGAAPDSR